MKPLTLANGLSGRRHALIHQLAVGGVAAAIALLSAPTASAVDQTSELLDVSLPAGSNLLAQSTGLEVWSTLDTRQATLNSLYKQSPSLQYCAGKFLSKDVYALYYGTAEDGVRVAVEDYEVHIARGADADFPECASS